MKGSILQRLKDFATRLWSAAPIATLILALALLATAVFGVRSAIHWIDRPTIAERQQPIEAWMTPRYVVRSWDVPRNVVLDVLDVPLPLPDGPTSLSRIAELRDVPVEQVIAEVQAAIAAHQAEHGGSSDD